MTEPAVREVHGHLVAQLSFRADPAAVTDQQHANHQFRINRRPTGVAIVRREMFAKARKIENPIDITKQVILRHDLVKIERVKQLVLRLIVAAHHRKQLRQSARSDYLIYALHRRVFQQNRPEPVGQPLISFDPAPGTFVG